MVYKEGKDKVVNTVYYAYILYKSSETWQLW